jgi:NAD(P)-dependent dehydrogenase (short-subunit alcohol dehydrogenase family)
MNTKGTALLTGASSGIGAIYADRLWCRSIPRYQAQVCATNSVQRSRKKRSRERLGGGMSGFRRRRVESSGHFH